MKKLLLHYMHQFSIFLLFSMVLVFANSFPKNPGTSVIGTPCSSPTSTSSPTVILEASIFSNNNCGPCYAIDEDLITFSFTTATPCQLPAQLSYPSSADSTQSGVCNLTNSCTMLLLNPKQDYRHWLCVFRIKNGVLPDQYTITAYQLLDCIFNGDYCYYGNNPRVTYFAPIEYTYRIRPLTASDNPAILSESGNLSSVQFYLLEFNSNHPVQFLMPERISNEKENYWSVSVIDAAGNGPCCITIPLEDTEFLLYNLSNMENDCTVFPSFSNEK
ncbi:MAG: hypothetical protein J6B50_00055 [Lachnospiraceae bacterium]|nr:hypothetical protein [Lachnospiraceae bacterium]